jgi:hypothetical protein
MKLNIALSALTALVFAFAPPANAAKNNVKLCIVTGEDLGDDPVLVKYKGREIPLCCKSCVKKFNANPEKYVAAYDKELAKRKH